MVLYPWRENSDAPALARKLRAMLLFAATITIVALGPHFSKTAFAKLSCRSVRHFRLQTAVRIRQHKWYPGAISISSIPGVATQQKSHTVPVPAILLAMRSSNLRLLSVVRPINWRNFSSVLASFPRSPHAPSPAVVWLGRLSCPGSGALRSC